MADGEGTVHRASTVLLVEGIVLIVALVATPGWRAASAAAERTSTPTLERSRAIPKLVPAPSQLRDECVSAAGRLGVPRALSTTRPLTLRP